MRHPDHATIQINNMKDLAKSIADMRYDVLKQFIGSLAGEILAQSVGDAKRCRPQLSKELSEASEHLYKAEFSLQLAWEICKSHEMSDG